MHRVNICERRIPYQREQSRMSFFQVILNGLKRCESCSTSNRTLHHEIEVSSKLMDNDVPHSKSTAMYLAAPVVQVVFLSIYFPTT
jgi:hypothetical protein